MKPNKVEKVLKYENPASKNLTAKITSISQMGLVKVKFNASLDLSAGIDYFRNHTTIKVLPASFREEHQGFNQSWIFLTWDIVSFTAAGDLTFQVNFSQPLQISPLLIQDKLQV